MVVEGFDTKGKPVVYIGYTKELQEKWKKEGSKNISIGSHALYETTTGTNSTRIGVANGS